MMKRSLIRKIALAAALVLMISLFAACGEQEDDLLNQVGQAGNNISTQQNGVGNDGGSQDSSGDTQQGGEQDSQQSGEQDSQQGGEQDSQQGGSSSTPQGGQSADSEGDAGDPYAAMKADKSGTPLKILCQNLRLNADQGTDNDIKIRRYRFQWLVNKYDPDVICGQEADADWITILGEDYSKTYDMFYQYRGSTSGSDEACPVLWKKDKYTKEASGYFWFSDTPNVSTPSFVGGHPRIANWVALKDKQTGQLFYIYSAHFSLDLKPPHLEKTRKIFADQFKRIPKNAYAFVMGDFNISYESDQYYALVDGTTLSDLRPISEEMAENGHCTLGDIRKGAYNAFKKDDGSVFGDFIMTLPRKNLAIDTFGYLYEKPAVPEKNIGPGFVSDHFAVYTEVRMGSKVSYAEYFGDGAA